MKKRRFRVHEKVVFEYVFVVEAESAADAKNVINLIGDGEAIEHNELSRRVISVERLSGKVGAKDIEYNKLTKVDFKA